MADATSTASYCAAFDEDLKSMIGGELPEEEARSRDALFDNEEYLDSEDLHELSEDVGDRD